MIEQTYPTNIEVSPDAQDWQYILELTKQPTRVFICIEDPLTMVDALIEQLSHDKLKLLVDELVYRTKLFF
jgi:hypothetical protein